MVVHPVYLKPTATSSVARRVNEDGLIIARLLRRRLDVVDPCPDHRDLRRRERRSRRWHAVGIVGGQFDQFDEQTPVGIPRLDDPQIARAAEDHLRGVEPQLRFLLVRSVTLDAMRGEERQRIGRRRPARIGRRGIRRPGLARLVVRRIEDRDEIAVAVRQRRAEVTADGEDNRRREEREALHEPRSAARAFVHGVFRFIPPIREHRHGGEEREQRGFADGEPHLTPISGKAGDIKRTVDFDDRAIDSLQWSEQSDKACELQVIDRDEERQSKLQNINQCRNKGFACEDAACLRDGVDYTGDGIIRLSPESAIYSARVCMNANGERVKGIEIGGARILSDGTISDVHESDVDRMPNCSDNRWKTLVLCPTDHAATGVRAHFKKGAGLSSNVDALSGLQLVCRRVILEGDAG